MSQSFTDIKKRVKEIEATLAREVSSLSPQELQTLTREYHEQKTMLSLLEKREKIASDISSLKQLDEKDESMQSEIEGEVTALAERLKIIEQELRDLSTPRDQQDVKNAVVEIRAGAGGDEAALFAADLFRMYARYSDIRGWKTNVLNENRTGLKGYKEIIFLIEGKNAYGTLKYESGVHRVQRIPETEKSGRVHTSTATVAVLPEAEDVDVDIKPDELRIDTFMSGGKGGQSVNTTYSAVRITHMPTGIVVSCQDERSQAQNKLKAMKVLKSRLLMKKIEEQQSKTAAQRKSQVGTGDRSEKIRTYNIPQDRVTDHRVKQSWGKIDSILDGNIQPIIDVFLEIE